MPLGVWRGRWRLIKELNPNALRRAAEQPWTLAIEAEPAAAGRLARALLGAPVPLTCPPHLRLPAGAWDSAGGTAGSWRIDLHRIDAPVAKGAPAGDGLALRLALRPLEAADFAASGGAQERRLVLPAGAALPDLGPIGDAIAVLEADLPDLGMLLARRLPGLRPVCIGRLIEAGARANAAYALGSGVAEIAPGFGLVLAPADLFILTKNQILLAFKVALAAGRQEDNRTLIVQLFGVLGSGLLFRQVARELVGLLPLIGLLPKVAVAYAGTLVIGQVAWAWADEGRRISGPERHRLYHEAMLAAAAWARRLLPGSPAARQPSTRSTP